jgi:hypothetical protein
LRVPRAFVVKALRSSSGLDVVNISASLDINKIEYVRGVFYSAYEHVACDVDEMVDVFILAVGFSCYSLKLL